MSTASDRRAPHTTRIPFDAMVEVGGALGPTFEAQAVNLSEEGMHLRTAYLPEIGQPVTCRFDAGGGLVVVAAGEVLWNEDMGEGGEFGIRFTNLDTQSAAALNRILGTGGDEDAAGNRAMLGRKVRLHIEGLASPMRARVKDANDTCVKAFSELGFLQVGKSLEVEDAEAGTKRPAQIDSVAVELEQASRVPQLVVSLRYDAREQPAHGGYDSQAPVTIEQPAHDDAYAAEAHADAHGAASGEDEMESDEPRIDVHEGEEPAHMAASSVPATRATSDDLAEESAKLKGPIARTASKITPAIESWAKRAKTTIALLAAKRKGGSGDDVAIPVRRTTAPPPGGGLHASGRKVVRASVPDEQEKMTETKSGLAAKLTKKRAAVAGAVGVAAILGLVAMRKPAAPPPAATAEAEGAEATTTTAANAAPATPIVPGAPAATTPAGGALANTPGALPGAPLAPAAAPAVGPAMDPGALASSDSSADTGKPHKKVKVPPFGNGPVGHNPNVLRLKMDGYVEKLLGASQPTGFTVVIPNRKSLDAAGPLAAKDSRIAAIRVSNEANGAELTVTFKDGVPNYLVRANGENLELVLASTEHANDKPAAAHVTTHGKKKHGKKH